MIKPLLNFVTLLFFVFTSCLVKADPGFEDVHVLARIHSIHNTRVLNGYAIEFENSGVSESLKKLAPDDEVLLKGHITYRPVKSDTRMEMNPVFHIDSIHPVSLKELGLAKDRIAEPSRTFTTTKIATPVTIAVTPEVAGAMTMTASFLMLQNLTSAQSPQTNSQIQQATFLSAGVLATGYFIWKQLRESKEKKGRL